VLGPLEAEMAAGSPPGRRSACYCRYPRAGG